MCLSGRQGNADALVVGPEWVGSRTRESQSSGARPVDRTSGTRRTYYGLEGPVGWVIRCDKVRKVGEGLVGGADPGGVA